MSLKSAVKRIENYLRLDDEREVIIFYDIPNEDGTVDVMHVSSRGTWMETITGEEYEKRTGKQVVYEL